MQKDNNNNNNLKVKKNTASMVALLIAGLCFGTIPIFSAFLRDYGASSLEQTINRLFIGAIFSINVLLFSLVNKKEQMRLSLDKKTQATYALQGLIMPLMIIVYLSSVSVGTPVGEAALLVQIHPFVTLFLGWLLLKEEISKMKLGSLCIAFSGIILLTKPWEIKVFSSLLGDLFALLNGVFYALYILAGTYSAKYRKNISSFISINWVIIWALIFGIPLVLISSLLPFPQTVVRLSWVSMVSPPILLFSVLLTMIGSFLPYSFIMLASPYVESSKSSIILLVEPIGAIIFGALFLQEDISLWYLVGGIMILFAVLLLVLETRRKKMKGKKKIEPDKIN